MFYFIKYYFNLFNIYSYDVGFNFEFLVVFLVDLVYEILISISVVIVGLNYELVVIVEMFRWDE